MTEEKKLHEKVFDILHDNACEFVSRDEQVPPTVAIVDSEGSMMVVDLSILPFVHDKNRVAALHRNLAEHYQVAALVMEAWSHVGKVNDALEKALREGTASLKDVEGSTECVLFNFRVGSEQFISACPIDRATKTLGVGELVKMDEKWDGRMIGSGRDKKDLH